VTPEDVSAAKDGKIANPRRRITDDGLRSCSARLSPPETIVLTKRAPIGQLAVAAVKLCSNQGCFLLEPASGVDPQFYFHWLNAHAAYLQVLGRGSTFMELSTDDLKSLNVPHPPIGIQSTIAQFLNDNTAQIDALIDAKQALLKLLAEKRRMLVAEAVMRGLDRSAPLRPSGIDWLGDIPAHWEVRRLATLFAERDERNEPELPLLEVSINTGVSVRQFSSTQIEGTAADFNTYKVARKGSIAFNKMRMWQGAVGVTPTDGLISPDYVVAAPSPEIDAGFAGLLFRTPAFSAECARNSQGITWDRLRLYWDGFRDISIGRAAANRLASRGRSVENR
jgi:type I restriction enzyme S subunit